MNVIGPTCEDVVEDLWPVAVDPQLSGQEVRHAAHTQQGRGQLRCVCVCVCVREKEMSHARAARGGSFVAVMSA
jgi:hypothetical protein